MTPPTLAAMQAAPQAAWVGPTVAISLVLIALAFLTIAVVFALVGREAAQALHKLSKELGDLRTDIEPALRAVREMADEGRGLAAKLQAEATDIIRTSQRVRHDVERGVTQARRRLADLDALAEVMQEELEDTALDVAARLRSVRSGLGVVGRVRRLLTRRRR